MVCTTRLYSGTGSAEESLAGYPELCESQSLLRSQVNTDEWRVSSYWWDL